MAKKNRESRVESTATIGQELIEGLEDFEATLEGRNESGPPVRPQGLREVRPLLRSIELPLCDPPEDSYIARERLGHIDVQLKTPQQRRGLRRLHEGLIVAGARFQSGRPVSSKADVLRYVFEQLGAADPDGPADG